MENIFKYNNDSISISQGKKFKEGLNGLNGLNGINDLKDLILNNNGLTEKSQQIIKDNDTKNSQQILENLRSEYKNALDEYNKLYNEISSNNSDFINRTSSNNPYLNKLIRFTTDEICYVTNQGIVKYIPSPEILDSLSINKDYIQLNIPYINDYANPGTQIPTNPPLITGTFVEKNQSLGNEGINIFVNDFLPNNINTKYLGCFNSNTNNDNLTWVGDKPTNDKTGIYDYNSCKQNAIHSGNRYFSLQNGFCGVSNNSDELTKYGDGMISKLIPLWASNTYGKNTKFFKITNDGRLYLADENGDIIWQNTGENKTDNCWWNGKINPDSLSATYGGNCKNISSGNVSQKIKDMLKDNNYPDQLNLAINNSILGDPSVGCKKDFSTSYQCGNEWKTVSINKSEGQYFLYDCKENAKKCNFILLLNDDGNLIWYRGTDTQNTTELIWSSNTSGKAIDNTNNYSLSKSKYGRNYLKSNETLAVGDYLSSNNGKVILILQDDGNLVLYTWQKTLNCTKMNDGNMSGGYGSNAVYDIGVKSNISNIGKLAYIDENSKLYNYDDNNPSYINDYREIKGTDAYGLDIPNLAFTNASLEKCKEVCNNTKDCAGFVLSADNSHCYPKTSKLLPFGSNFHNNINYNTYIRTKIPSNPPIGVLQNTNNIDSIKYDNYIKGGKLQDSYGISNINTVKKQQLQQLQDKINLLANQLNNYTSKFGTGTLLSENQSVKNISGLDNYIKDFKNTNNNILQVIDKTNNSLQNISDESNVVVLQKNYNYMFWTIIATATILISMKIIKK